VLEVAAVDQHGLVVVVGRIGRRRQAADRRRRRGGGHGEGHGVGGLRVLVGDEQGPVAGSVAVVERQAQLAAGDEGGRFVLIGDAIGIVEGDRGAVLEVAAVDQHGLVVVVGRIGRRRQAADRRRRHRVARQRNVYEITEPCRRDGTVPPQEVPNVARNRRRGRDVTRFRNRDGSISIETLDNRNVPP